MPRACPVESHGIAFKTSVGELRLAINVSLHGASPWHPVTSVLLHLAANVNLHGSSPWHHAQSTVQDSSKSISTARWAFTVDRNSLRRRAAALRTTPRQTARSRRACAA